jgi:hypothetical protein
VRISIEQYKGIDLIDIRKWYSSNEDDAPGPSKAGIALNVKHLPALAEAVSKALAIAYERCMVAPKPEVGGGK